MASLLVCGALPCALSQGKTPNPPPHYTQSVQTAHFDTVAIALTVGETCVEVCGASRTLPYARIRTTCA